MDDSQAGRGFDRSSGEGKQIREALESRRDNFPERATKRLTVEAWSAANIGPDSSEPTWTPIGQKRISMYIVQVPNILLTIAHNLQKG
jgi:hypothetical protein